MSCIGSIIDYNVLKSYSFKVWINSKLWSQFSFNNSYTCLWEVERCIPVRKVETCLPKGGCLKCQVQIKFQRRIFNYTTTHRVLNNARKRTSASGHCCSFAWIQMPWIHIVDPYFLLKAMLLYFFRLWERAIFSTWYSLQDRLISGAGRDVRITPGKGGRRTWPMWQNLNQPMRKHQLVSRHVKFELVYISSIPKLITCTEQVFYRRDLSQDQCWRGDLSALNGIRLKR